MGLIGEGTLPPMAPLTAWVYRPETRLACVEAR